MLCDGTPPLAAVICVPLAQPVLGRATVRRYVALGLVLYLRE